MGFRSCWGGWLDKMLSVHLCLSSQFGGSSICYSNMYTIKSSSLGLNEAATSAVVQQKGLYLQTSYIKSLSGRLFHDEQKIPEATIVREGRK